MDARAVARDEVGDPEALLERELGLFRPRRIVVK
jgi:hypothetical protein